MSLPRHVEITCPQCNTTQEMTLWDSVNATEHPHLKEEILEQRLNAFFCSQCDYHGSVDNSVLYHDMDGKFCVQYVAKEDMKSPKYYRHLSKQGTLIFDPLSTKIMGKSGGEYLSRPHHVFSMKEMLLYILFRQFCAEYGRDVDEAAGE